MEIAVTIWRGNGTISWTY